MKTTLNIEDGLYRRAKSRAALMGIPLGRFLEQSLERSLAATSEAEPASWEDWASQLPDVPAEGIDELKETLNASEFRPIDSAMWT